MLRHFYSIGLLLSAVALMATPGHPSNLCDVNNDRSVNISDAQTEVNEALETTACVNDLNKDGKCDVSDVQRIINAALTGICNTSSPGTPAVPTTGVYLGYEPDTGFTEIPTMEAMFGRQFAIAHGNWNDGYQFPASGDLQTANSDHNAMPMVTLANMNRTLAEIINNKINPSDTRPNYQNSPDSFYKSWANGLKAYGKPMFLRLDHEMNGNWYSYCFQPGQSECMDQDTGVQQTAADYVNAWRHIHDLFVAAGATNVAFVWCPNAVEGAGAAAVTDMSSYYPGDAYVDWTCFDAYNWNNPPAYTVAAMDFTTMITNTYNKIVDPKVAPTKPMMIGEFNTNLEGDSTGIKKGAWLTDAYNQMRTNANFASIKAAVLFDVDDISIGQVDWRVANTAPGTAGLKAGIAYPYFLSQ